MSEDERARVQERFDQVERALSKLLEGGTVSIAVDGAIGAIAVRNINGRFRERIELALARELVELGQLLVR